MLNVQLKGLTHWADAVGIRLCEADEGSAVEAEEDEDRLQLQASARADPWPETCPVRGKVGVEAMASPLHQQPGPCVFGPCAVPSCVSSLLA